MSLGYSSTPIPFTNRGIVQREDPALMQPGEYLDLRNMYSQQEGNLTIRTGHKQLTASLAAPIHTISKMNIGGVDYANPRYLGSADTIYRTDAAYAATSVYSGLTSGQRWGSQQYNAGATGKPANYFGTTTKSLKDANPSGPTAAQLYTTLQNWGIDPPAVPVTATPMQPLVNYVTGLATQRFIQNVNSDNTAGCRKTCSAFGSGTGYVKITPTAAAPINGLAGIYVGQLLQITDGVGGNEVIMVLLTDATSFYAVTTLAHSAANVYLTWTQQSASSVLGTSAIYLYQAVSFDFNWDASYNGVAADGYESDDTFHVALRCDDVSVVTSFDIRVVPNFTTDPALGESKTYYQYTVSTAAIMSNGSATAPNWVELAIPKNKFTKVGNAGTGAYTWKKISQVYVVAHGTAATATFAVSDIYFIGGGGLNSFAAGTTPYDWLYVYVNPSNGNQSNPCVPMIDSALPPPILNGKATLTLTGVDTSTSGGNADYSGAGSIAIYRRGGSFADGLYRHVGFATNPGVTGAVPNTVTFVDNASDASITTQQILEFDNEPPVRSTLKVPLTASIAQFQAYSSGIPSGVSTATSTAGVINRVILSNLPTNFDATTIGSVINYGSTIQLGVGPTAETCIVYLSGYGTNGYATSAWLDVYTQYSHAITSADASEIVECGSTNRGKCDLVCSDFDCMFLAGDPNNPATLYQSKVGRPENWPVINLASGAAHQVTVGSPSNPINGITSMNGEIISLNLNNIFVVQMWNGQMQQPQKTQSSRGLYSKWCWCKGAETIWFLAYDGIYRWSGGDCVKISEQIEYMFRNLTVSGIVPVDMTQALKFSMSFARNQLFFTCIDTAGKYLRLRYDLAGQRWTIETILSGATQYQINAAYTEEDTGNALFSITNGSSQSYLWWYDFRSTTDGWTSAVTDGLAISYVLKRFWPLGDPGTDYQVGEIMLELTNPSDAITAALFYNYGAAATETMTVASGFAAARARFMRTVNSGTPQTAYSIGMQLSGTSGTTATPVFFYTFAARELKLEEVTTGPATDWDSLGHPYDKYLKDCTIEYDTGGQSILAYFDTINGVAGTTQNLAVSTFTLSGAGRSRQTYVLPDATVVRMARIRPQYTSDLKQLKLWNVRYSQENYPPSLLFATDWDSSGYPCDKIFKWLTIQVDTGGIAASVSLEVDGTAVHTFSVTGTFLDRSSVITLPSGIIGKQWRIVPTIGTGGKFQLFGVQANFEKDACEIAHWDSLYQVLGSDGFKFIKQIWLDFQCSTSVIFSIYRDGGTLFYQETLPAQATRAVTRFYAPDRVDMVLNKSKAYRFCLDSSDGVTGVKMYRDGCRVETRNLSGDQRGGYFQTVMWQNWPLAV